VKQKLSKKSEKSEKIDMNFASLCLASKQKLLNRSEAENLKRKKTKKTKNAKKAKKKKKGKKRKNRLEFRFALFRFEAKITKVKRSQKFEAKRSEKREVKFYSEIVKHM
jgi:hypothetical protein